MFTQPLDYNQNVNDVTVNLFYWMDTKPTFKSNTYSEAFYTVLSWIADDNEGHF